MIHHGDCVEVMAGMDADSIDAIVTDPPYGLEFMGKEWDRLWAKRDKSEDLTGKSSSPFLAAQVNKYEAGLPAQQWHQRWATEALRVAKPGAYLLAFGGTRTVHRLTVALEDAGWIIRDVLVWAYAQGFPKSKSSLKPAWEPIVLARKPGPLAPLNIDECRLPTAESDTAGWYASLGSGPKFTGNAYNGGNVYEGDRTPPEKPSGRWPANVVLTDPIFDGEASRFFLIPKASRRDREPDVPGELEASDDNGDGSFGLVAACPHTSPDYQYHREPRRNTHPTVKPTRLMRHLVRLVTPEGGTVLDPFLGSGTTAKAAVLEGFDWVGIEREAEYIAIAKQRLVGLEPEPMQMEMTA